MPSNACFGFETTTGWTFFDLNTLHDEYKDEPGTVVEADFVSHFASSFENCLQTLVSQVVLFILCVAIFMMLACFVTNVFESAAVSCELVPAFE